MLKIKIGLETLTIRGLRVTPKSSLASSVAEMLAIHTAPTYAPDPELDFFTQKLEPLGATLVTHQTDKPEAQDGKQF